MTPARDGEIVTVAELTADPASGRPVRAELKGIGGSSDRFFVAATDGTSS